MIYQNHIFCCVNERPCGHKRGCCKSKGSEKLRNYMKARVKELGLPNTRVNTSGCLDQCEYGPVMVIYPDGVWYTYRTTEDIDEIIDAHLKHGKIVERLKLPHSQTPTQQQG